MSARLTPFYIMDGTAYFNIAVRRQTDIPSLHLPLYMTGILERAVELRNAINNEDEAVTAAARKISTRVNVQCPGVVEYFGPVLTIIALAVIGVLVVGGKLKISRDQSGNPEVELSTDGLMEKIISFLQLYYENKKKSAAISDGTLEEVNNDLNIKIPRKRN